MNNCDMDSCSDETLRCGAELVVHAYHDGRAPGLERIEKKIAHLWDVPESELGLSPAMMGAIRRYARAIEERTGELPDWAVPYMEGGA